jgi:PAS domain S-box-containing protein
MGAVALVVALILHLLVSRRVAKMRAISQRFAAGDHEARVRLEGGDELAGLGQAFDHMADKIVADQRALRNSERKLSLHLRQTILGVIEWDRDFRAREWNPAAELIFGYSREEALGRHAADLILPPEVAEEIDTVWRQILSQKGGSYNHNENVTRGGRTILCEWFNTPLVDDNGSVTGVMSLARDVTAEKQAEEALHLQAIELEEEVAERQLAQEALQEQALLLESEVEERRNAQEELEQLNDSLEQRVHERTAELEAKNSELHKMNRLFVGRELRMVELKERIRELEIKAGE